MIKVKEFPEKSVSDKIAWDKTAPGKQLTGKNASEQKRSRKTAPIDYHYLTKREFWGIEDKNRATNMTYKSELESWDIKGVKVKNDK